MRTERAEPGGRCTSRRAGKNDVRSSYALEDVATEFDIQGLELDWVGMCWDANFRREDNKWKPYYFRGSRWERVQDPTRGGVPSKRVSRAADERTRQGMVILVPRGTELD
ncbi:DNA/RNA helicase domain-containing protein [Bradyrhizobium sp. SZCCHNS3004]|uniref:DNA/RNA helicase domain-containing protein n=1 Tax=unclassified Bradyrhizobium TaxID=2631580 RepID=UPI003966F834